MICSVSHFFVLSLLQRGCFLHVFQARNFYTVFCMKRYFPARNRIFLTQIGRQASSNCVLTPGWRHNGLRRSREGWQMPAEVRKLAMKPHSTLLLNFLMTVLGLIGICLHSFYILTFCRQFLLVLIHKVCNKAYKTAKRKIISCLYLHFSCYIFCFISICVYLQRISKQKSAKHPY